MYGQLLVSFVLEKFSGFPFGSFYFTNLVIANATSHTRTRWQQVEK
jgi:hypothetical protein